MALIIQLQGHPWVKGLLHKTLLSHQSVAASWLYNNVISYVLKVFKAFPKLPSLWCSGTSVVKRSHIVEHEHRGACSAGAFLTLSLLLAIYPFLVSRLMKLCATLENKELLYPALWRGKTKKAQFKWLFWSTELESDQGANLSLSAYLVIKPKCYPFNSILLYTVDFAQPLKAGKRASNVPAHLIWKLPIKNLWEHVKQIGQII